jgi:hypothetical protein
MNIYLPDLVRDHEYGIRGNAPVLSHPGDPGPFFQAFRGENVATVRIHSLAPDEKSLSSKVYL